MNPTAAQATAVRMIGAVKLTVTLQPTVTKGSAAATPIQVHAASLPASAHDDRFSKDAKVRGRQRLVYMAATDVNGAPFADPKADDLIKQLESDVWRVLSNSPLRPDGVTTVFHELAVEL